ncbi:MAG TPA: hypothetical protein VEI48_11410 [Candidatus Sulfotelmatobacter sp.]|nr:hypothetical protein [Candidatus Sulfotelmatobacter sp.]
MRALVGALVLAVLAAACTSISSPSATPTTTPVATSSPAASETIECVRFPGPLPTGLTGDPCPSAIAAVLALVVPLKLSIARLHIAPGFFMCGIVWPGFQTGPVCAGPLIAAGTAMESYVAFVASPKVDAVQLFRALPNPRSVPLWKTTQWQATQVAYEVPPSGWVMP